MSAPDLPANDDQVVYFDAAGRPLERGPAGLEVIEGSPAGSDDVLALIFARARAADTRWVGLWSEWKRWNGRVWETDHVGRTFDEIRESNREAIRPEEGAREARRLAGFHTARNVEGFVKVDRRIRATIEQWDRDDLLLNTPGGVQDLAGWRERAARPEDYLTRSTAVPAAPEQASAALWREFLLKIFAGDVELIDYVQRVSGYFLTGSTKEHALFFAWGSGANGKSVFANTVLGILGSYAITSPIETFMASDNDRHPTELADLVGARLVVANETEQGRRWAEARLKQLTGGDPIKARRMREDFFEFRPNLKLLILGNHKPVLRAVDEAIRRRLHLIPFNVTIPPAERDPDLTDKLKAEWPAILRWMVDGYRMYVDQGLRPPAAVRDATTEYLDAEDSLALWLNERCELDLEAFEPTSALFASWQRWAKASGEFPGSIRRFSQMLESHGYRQHRRNSARGYVGIRVRGIFEEASSDASDACD